SMASRAYGPATMTIAPATEGHLRFKPHPAPAPVQNLTRRRAMSVADRLKELGITLSPPPPPVANYVRAKQFGGLLFVAGQRPAVDANGNRPEGKIGADLTLDEAYQIARELGIRLLGAANEQLGSLDRVKSVLKVTGLINSAP